MLSKYSNIIEEALEKYVAATDLPQKNVIEAMRYSLLCGGKRLRPALTLELFHIFKGDPTPAVPAACAVEMIHTYSLIHDDLPCMDDDIIRRGKPSCHIKFDEATALLAGDALLTLAFETVLSSHGELRPESVLLAVKELASAAGAYGMIGGQVIDLDAETRSITEQELRNLHKNKTGALIRAAVLSGCILAEADKIQIEAAKKYAEALGLQFQIIDDILDVVSDTETLGKPVGSDSRSGKTTYVTLFGIERAREIAARQTEAAIKCLEPLGSPESLIKLAENMLERIN